jgi:hypothetical protein
LIIYTFISLRGRGEWVQGLCYLTHCPDWGATPRRRAHKRARVCVLFLRVSPTLTYYGPILQALYVQKTIYKHLCPPCGHNHNVPTLLTPSTPPPTPKTIKRTRARRRRMRSPRPSSRSSARRASWTPRP